MRRSTHGPHTAEPIGIFALAGLLIIGAVLCALAAPCALLAGIARQIGRLSR